MRPFLPFALLAATAIAAAVMIAGKQQILLDVDQQSIRDKLIRHRANP